MGKISIQKAKLLRKENTTSKNGHSGTKLTYMHIKDDGTQKEGYVQWINQYLPDDSKKILETLNEGSEFVVVKEEEGQYWNFKELRDVKTYQPKPVWDGNSRSQNATSKSGYNDTGVKVGAARNQAIALLANEKFADELAPGKTFNLNHVDQLAYEIVKRQAAMEDKVRNEGKNKQAEEEKSKTESHNQDQYPQADSDVPF